MKTLLAAIFLLFLPATLALASPLMQVGPPLPAVKTVLPDQCHTNNDGVTVCNNPDSQGNFVVNPATGSADSATTVDVKSSASGSVSGIDGNDTVNVANGASDVNISGTGGTVDLTAGGSSGSITNTSPAGGEDITVKTSGDEFKVPPGSTLHF